MENKIVTYHEQMTYEGNMLTSVRDQASHSVYAGATDFDGIPGQEYPLTYNDAGSLTSDAGRRIAWIDYDLMNNPVRIQFTNGSVTRYVYSAAGEKLRVTYQTAVPNISVPIGSTRELAFYEVQYTDSTDYLLGGRLTLKNGRIDKYQFEEGYCQAEQYAYNTSQDKFTFCYYDRDHLGNIRLVTEADGSREGNIIQTMNYYPFGAEFCDGSASYTSIQPYKYNGKEFDKMHGLNTYDYGARQYNPITARWDRMDPLCEKYYSLSPYNYCGNNPIRFIDPDGMWPWPWERGSLIEYRGNGVFGLRMSNFSGTTQRNFYAANNNPTNWKPGEIGISTVIGCIAIQQYGYQAYTPTNKSIGIDPKDGAVQIRRPIAVSTGQEDRRFHKYSPSYVNGRAGAGAMLALNIALGVSDTFLTLSSFWDAEAFTNQKNSLDEAINTVDKYINLIPEVYRGNLNLMGAIINYVFQGENLTKNKNIETIGKRILEKSSRYDDKEKKYRPFIEE